jgi:Large ribosomal RNA subunit accumulation protein YceD
MKRKTNTTGELGWEHATHDIPQSGLSREREAAPDELARIARALDLVACASLRTAYAIVPTVGGRFRLSGRLRAEISQACVVTLEPVDSTIDEGFDVTFWPEEEMPAPRGGEVDMDEEADPEPIVAGQIDVGRVVFECLAACVDPFPRKPDAVLDRSSSHPIDAGASKPDSPFAVLANVKTRP